MNLSAQDNNTQKSPPPQQEEQHIYVDELASARDPDQ